MPPLSLPRSKTRPKQAQATVSGWRHGDASSSAAAVSLGDPRNPTARRQSSSCGRWAGTRSRRCSPPTSPSARRAPLHTLQALANPGTAAHGVRHRADAEHLQAGGGRPRAQGGPTRRPARALARQRRGDPLARLPGGSAADRSRALVGHGAAAWSSGGSPAVRMCEPVGSLTGPMRQPWRVPEVGERTKGDGHGGGRCVAGQEAEDHGREDEGKIDHRQTLGGHVRLYVGLSHSEAYTVTYFNESKNCNSKTQNR